MTAGRRGLATAGRERSRPHSPGGEENSQKKKKGDRRLESQDAIVDSARRARSPAPSSPRLARSPASLRALEDTPLGSLEEEGHRGPDHPHDLPELGGS
jgi:hypothetical protein